MQKIIYYVASSLDGFIAGPQDDISQFILEGEGVKKYQEDLLQFKTVLMGRRTYEFAYQFGLPPGQPAYPNMTNHVFSESMKLKPLSDLLKVEKRSLERVKEIKATSETAIYLCGGGTFAGWLLDHGLIDQVKIKLNPIVLGKGTRIFGASKTAVNLDLVDQVSFNDGLQILTYDVR